MKCTHCGGEMVTEQWHLSKLAVARELRCMDCGAQRLCSTLRHDDNPISTRPPGTAASPSAMRDDARPRRHRTSRLARTR